MGLSKTALLLCVLESFSVFAGDYEVVVDFGLRILESLKRRIDPKTGLAKPDWKGIARELHVSRSTIARQMVGIRESGAVESVLIYVRAKVAVIRYRLKV